MQSLNRHVANDRLARVYDARVAALAEEKDVKAHIKAIRSAVEAPDAQVNEGVQSFLKQARGAQGRRK